ncbi:Uncharacterised protein [Bordetella pertussis]|nr:Uncharacterised protein [Bordetella pertussis]
MVQRQHGARALAFARGVGLDRVVVGADGGDAAVGDPLQQFGVGAVQRGAILMQHVGVGLAVHADHGFGVAGAQHQHVAGLDLDAVCRQRLRQFLVAHQGASGAVVARQVQQHAAALHAVLGQVLDAQLERGRGAAGIAAATGVVGVGRPDDVDAGAVAVVIAQLGAAVAVGVEQRADVGQRIPLRGVLHR